MSNQPIRVIVIGAGYAGMLATVRLADKTRRQNVQITLVNPMETFVERLRLHQFAANQAVKQRPIAEILRGTGVSFVQAEARSIDADKHEVELQAKKGGQRLTYDYLLCTAGSITDLDSVPGVRQHAYTLTASGPLSASALRSTLPDVNLRGGNLVVVGGGPTGIEAAAEFAESYPNLHVTLVTRGEVSGALGGKIKSNIVKSLSRLGVVMREHAAVTRLEMQQIITETGDVIPFDVCLWAGGFAVPNLARETGLAVNERGQILIDPFMRSISHPNIYAAGDCAQPTKQSGMHVRMAALTATITGAHAADCLANALNGKPQKPLDFAYIGQGIALGRHNAVGFNNFPDDRPKWPIFTGWLGYYGREFFVNLLAELANIERHVPGFLIWPGRGKIRTTATVSIQGQAKPRALTSFSSQKTHSER